MTCIGHNHKQHKKSWVPHGWVVYREAQSATLHKGPLWDAVIDIPIHHSQKVSNLRVMRHAPADTQFTNNPIFSTIIMLLSKGTTIRLGQRQKSNSFSILGVAYITRHSLVKSIGEGRKKREMGA